MGEKKNAPAPASQEHAMGSIFNNYFCPIWPANQVMVDPGPGWRELPVFAIAVSRGTLWEASFYEGIAKGCEWPKLAAYTADNDIESCSLNPAPARRLNIQDGHRMGRPASMDDFGRLDPAAASDSQSAPGAPTTHLSNRNLLRIKVPVTVTMASKSQTVGKIVKIVPGSILQFNKPYDETLDLEVGTRRIAQGECVKMGDKWGFRIRSLILPAERRIG